MNKDAIRFCSAILLGVVCFSARPCRGEDAATEPIFLLNMLAESYTEFPSNSILDELDKQKVIGIYNQANEIKCYAVSKGLNKRLSDIADDVMASANAYSSLNEDLVNIPQVIERLKQQGSFNSGYEAGYNGVGTALAMSDEGAEKRDAVVGGLLAAGISWLVSQDQENDRARAAGDMEKSKAISQFTTTIRDRYSHIKINAGIIADEVGVAVEETGWSDLPQQPNADGKTTIEANQVLAAYWRRMCAIRPHHAFSHLLKTFYEFKSKENPTVDDCLQASSECKAASALVPDASFFNARRAFYIAEAARIASIGTSLEHGSGGFINCKPNSTAQLAENLWRETLRLEPLDAAGSTREQLAYALAYNGKQAEALDQAIGIMDLKSTSGIFRYNLACLFAISTNVDKALLNLKQAQELGFTDSKRAVNDPDLGILKTERSTEFNAIVNMMRYASPSGPILSIRDALINNDLGTATASVEKMSLMYQDPEGWFSVSSLLSAWLTNTISTDAQESFVKGWQEETTNCIYEAEYWKTNDIGWRTNLCKIQNATHDTNETAAAYASFILPIFEKTKPSQWSLVAADLANLTGSDCVALSEQMAGKNVRDVIPEFNPILKKCKDIIKDRTGIDINELLRGCDCEDQVKDGELHLTLTSTFMGRSITNTLTFLQEGNPPNIWWKQTGINSEKFK